MNGYPYNASQATYQHSIESRRVRRVAVGSLMTECNHLGGQLTDIARFEQYELCRGNEVLEIQAGSISGMLGELKRRGAEIVPLISASTCPGGPLTDECYDSLLNELLALLRVGLSGGPLDGVLLALHGAAAVESMGDLEGDLLRAVRKEVGTGVPIVATLDLHAHVTQLMLANADCLIGFEHYPHTDTIETGTRGAKILFDIMDRQVKPTMVMSKVPVIVGGVRGNTEGAGPFADVMRLAKQMEHEPGVLSTSLFLVHPYLDLPDMGGGGLVITNNDPQLAESLSTALAEEYWARRFDLDPPTYTPREAIEKGLALEGGPILLVETADCSGGGATGDSVHTLRALLEAAVDQVSLVPVVDPQAVQQCHARGIGETITVTLGHKLDPQWGQLLTVTGKILYLGDGKFRYSGGFWSGGYGEMGSVTVLQMGSIQVLITSQSTYDWADEQYRSVGMPVQDAKFVVVKNPMNYRLGYAGIAREAFILHTPGPTPATLHHVKFQNLQRPYYPADKDIPNLRPSILYGR